jgi:hypothetical protein
MTPGILNTRALTRMAIATFQMTESNGFFEEIG